VSPALIAQIFFIYGLAFFSMGLAILLERGRSSDPRLFHALRLLAFFGLVHGAHEWLEMFQGLGMLPSDPLAWASFRIAILAGSFLGLGGFGASLLAREERTRRLSLLAPLALAMIWGVGQLLMRSRFTAQAELWDVADVWTRYSLAIPSGLLAAAGLLSLRRSFLQAGMAQFGQDSLIASAAFAAYGVIGQLFTRPSPLPPSTTLNSTLFLQLFGFPVQLFRAAAAVVVMISVIRFMRSFEVERRQQLAELQAARLREAERRQALRGELLMRVVQAQEAERQRIARELHDETGQALTAIGMGLRGVESGLASPDSKSSQNLRHLQELTDRALNELQRLIAGLRPAHLDDLGLPAALRWYAGETQARAPLEVEVEIVGEERPLPALLTIGLFRAAQEALSNVVRHASARRAQVRLHYEAAQARLEVQDDGIGFDAAAVEANPERPAWGLMGMQERVALMGGQFRISSQRGHGTLIEIRVPYEGLASDEHARAIAAGG
jgi:signal transduction histidine kinase